MRLDAGRQHRRRRRGRRRDRRRLVCLLPAPRRPRPGRRGRASTLGQGRAAAPPASSGARAARRRRCAWPSGPATSTCRQCEELGVDSGFVRAGVLHARLHRGRRRRRPRPTGHAAERSATTSAWFDADEAEALNPTLAPGLDPRRHLLRRTTATSTRPATSSPTPSPSAAGVEVARAHGVQRAGDVPATGWSGVGPSGGTIATERVVLTGGPELAERGRPRRIACPGRRGPAPGGRHRAPPRPRPVPGADGLRPPDRPLLAARGGRAPVRHVQPGRAARARPAKSTGRTWRRCGAAWPSWSRSPAARAAAGLGGHDRLHT